MKKNMIFDMFASIANTIKGLFAKYLRHSKHGALHGVNQKSYGSIRHRSRPTTKNVNGAIYDSRSPLGRRHRTYLAADGQVRVCRVGSPYRVSPA